MITIFLRHSEIGLQDVKIMLKNCHIYRVMSVPPSSAGGVQLTTTLSWKISVTLQDIGGVGLSEM